VLAVQDKRRRLGRCALDLACAPTTRGCLRIEREVERDLADSIVEWLVILQADGARLFGAHVGPQCDGPAVLGHFWQERNRETLGFDLVHVRKNILRLVREICERDRHLLAGLARPLDQFLREVFEQGTLAMSGPGARCGEDQDRTPHPGRASRPTRPAP